MINRFVPQKFAHMLFGCMPVHVGRQRWTVVISNEIEEGLGERTGLGWCWRPVTQRLFEVCLETTPHTKNIGVPFQVIGHIFEATMVEFVHGPQRKLRILDTISF